MKDNLHDFYNLILQETTRSLLVFLAKNTKLMRKLPHEKKVMISFLIMKYQCAITDAQLKKQIEDVQLNKIQLFINMISKPLTSILNYSGTTVANFGNQFLNNRFGHYFPQINSDEIKTIFPDIKFDIEDDFNNIDISYSFLDTVLESIKSIVGSPVLVLFDRFDEDARIENDADLLSTFLKQLVTDNSLLLNDNIQLIISVWKIAFKNLSSSFRKSKHNVYEISWSFEYLENVLNHRLSVYSNNKIKCWSEVFEENFSSIHSIFDIANGNPRDLWDVLDKIFTEQYRIDRNKTKISSEAVERGMKSFVSEFNFYEYYPKRKNARRNTNDIYSYIKILLFLKGKEEFTVTELREASTSGGSIQNHITNMQKIGLVEKTDKKRAGGSVIYRIIDPKVRYVNKHGIEISH